MITNIASRLIALLVFTVTQVLPLTSHAESQIAKGEVWHHSPYIKGSHDSDTERGLIDMRENAFPILDSYEVDLVFSRHNYSYERSMLVDDHYGYSFIFNAQDNVDGGSGRVNGSSGYTKDSGLSTHGVMTTI